MCLCSFSADYLTNAMSILQEHVFSCYSLLQVMDTIKSNTPKSSVLPNSLLPCPCSIVTDNSSTSIAIGSKRRLTYSDNDQPCHSKKIHQGSGV